MMITTIVNHTKMIYFFPHMYLVLDWMLLDAIDCLSGVQIGSIKCTYGIQRSTGAKVAKHLLPSPSVLFFIRTTQELVSLQ